MIYGRGSVLCLMQMLHAMKNSKFRIFIIPLHILSFKWYQSHLSYDLHAKNIDNCKGCDYIY